MREWVSERVNERVSEWMKANKYSASSVENSVRRVTKCGADGLKDSLLLTLMHNAQSKSRSEKAQRSAVLLISNYYFQIEF